MVYLILLMFVIALVARYSAHAYHYSKLEYWDLHVWAWFTESALFWLCVFALPYEFTKSLLIVTGVDFALWGFVLQGMINISVKKPWFDPNESSHWKFLRWDIPKIRGYQRLYQGAAGLGLILAGFLL